MNHECKNWDCGSAIPFLGIFVSNFRYWFFAVHDFDLKKIFSCNVSQQFDMFFKPRGLFPLTYLSSAAIIVTSGCIVLML